MLGLRFNDSEIYDRIFVDDQRCCSQLAIIPLTARVPFLYRGGFLLPLQERPERIISLEHVPRVGQVAEILAKHATANDLQNSARSG
jgi:hypothetical protein